MGSKLTWTGLFMMVAAPALGVIPNMEFAGAVFMLIGVFLMWLNK